MTGSESKSGGQSSKLSRAVIVDAALQQIDEFGVQHLSMRSLAQHLGVEAMSLYRYVHGKDDLLEGVVGLLMADLLEDLDAELAEHWQGYLQAAAHRVRRIALQHPKVFPLIASRHPAAPWLRPPLRSIEVVNAFLVALIGYGFTDQQAVSTYRSFSSFLLGQLLLEASVRGGDPLPISDPLDSTAEDSSDLDDAPEVRRLRSMLSEDRSAEEFEVSLEVLLDRLTQELSQ